MPSMQDIARAIVKFDNAIGEVDKELKKVTTPLTKKKTSYVEKKEKLEAALKKMLEASKEKEVIVGNDKYGLGTSPGKVIIPDVLKIPKSFIKKVKPAGDLTKIKKAIKDKKLDPAKDNWFTFEQEVTLRHYEVKEEEEV